MAKYEVQHSCGHTETISLFGKTADRERKIEWLEREGLCSECYKEMLEKKRNEEREAAQKRAEELPELQGTEKQIAWAITLRDKVMQELDTVNVDADEREFLVNQTDVRYWIDTRHQNINERLDFVDAEIEMREIENSPEAKAAMDEATVFPENQQTKDVAELFAEKGYVTMVSPKNNAIIETIKSVGWSWSKSKRLWYHNTGVVDGSAEERLAEAGNALLMAGIPIRIFDAQIRSKAITGDFESVHPYWIVRDASIKKIKATWHGRISEDLYQNLMSLPHAKYRDGEIILDAKYYDDVRDFANIYNFRLSAGAETMLKEAEDAEKTKTIVKPKKGFPSVLHSGLHDRNHDKWSACVECWRHSVHQRDHL